MATRLRLGWCAVPPDQRRQPTCPARLRDDLFGGKGGEWMTWNPLLVPAEL